MWNELLSFNISPVNLLIRAVVVYLSILLLLRISGKRQMGQMGATEFVAILLISNAVQNAMNGGDNSLSGGLFLALILVVLSTAISFITYKSKFFSALFEGTPTLLVHKGKLIAQHLKSERMNERELRTLLRKQGFHELHEIETAILEADGTLTVAKISDRPALLS